MCEEYKVNGSSNSVNRYLCFSVDKKRFATPLMEVKEVVGNQDATPIPHSPAYFKGVINLRGSVISIIDLRTRLKIPNMAKSPEATIMILDIGHAPIGVIVDSVDCVTEYESSNIEPAPGADMGLHTEFLSGVAKDKDSLTLILNMSALFSAEDLKFIKSQEKPKSVA